MKAWILPLLAVVAGTAVGATTSLLKYQKPDLILAGHQAVANKPPLPVADAKPRAYLPSPTSYDFGVMARNDEKSHTFHVQNIGNGPLTLKVVDTTCKCTVGTLARDEIMAGETADVTLTWQALSYDREFRQSATIETSDQGQREIVFSVFGQVIQLARPVPPSMAYQRLSRSEPRQFDVKVYGYRDDDLKIIDHQFANTDLAKFFTVKTEPLPPAEWDDPEAKSGIRVTVDIQSGLPLGVVRQMLELHTNKSDIAPLTIGIDMTIVSDISVLGGANFNDDWWSSCWGGRTVSVFRSAYSSSFLISRAFWPIPLPS